MIEWKAFTIITYHVIWKDAMKISKQKHNEMMSTVIPPEKLDKIIQWLDEKITDIDSHSKMWINLVDVYLKIPEGKLTKAFLHQILTLNGIIDDGVHDKSFCSIRDSCKLLAEKKKEYNTENNDLICHNFNICLMIPYFQINPPFSLTEKEYVELDEKVAKSS